MVPASQGQSDHQGMHPRRWVMTTTLLHPTSETVVVGKQGGPSLRLSL